ncbi:MAG: methyltransferase domain-containing protein [Flavonifractor plautii]
MRAPERLGPYVYRQSDTCFPLGGDSLALAAFASVRRGDRVCDLGCGAGALLLLLAARVSPLALSGVEYCPEDAAMARQNLAENGLEGAICTGDLCAVCKTLRRGLLPGDLQPALLQGGERRLRRARPDGGGLRPEDWRAAAGRLLKNGDASPSASRADAPAISLLLPPASRLHWSPACVSDSLINAHTPNDAVYNGWGLRLFIFYCFKPGG